MDKPKLGIIAGSGRLPLELAHACKEAGRDYFIVALEGAGDETALIELPHAVVRIGAVGEALEHLRNQEVKEVVLAGGVKRPSVASLRPDATGAKLVARLGFKLFSGDDALLRAIVQFMEEEGFTVIGADAVLESLVAGEGLIAGPRPDQQAEEDIAMGLRVAHALGAQDIGQAIIVERGYVLGVEAAEGTDALIIRCAPLAREKKRAILVKVKKPGQEARADLPTVGPETITRLHEANMQGLAVEAGSALIIGRSEIRKLAKEYGLFVVGVKA